MPGKIKKRRQIKRKILLPAVMVEASQISRVKEISQFRGVPLETVYSEAIGQYISNFNNIQRSFYGLDS